MSYYTVAYPTDVQTHMSEPVSAENPTEAVKNVVGRNELFGDAPADVVFEVYPLSASEEVSRGAVNPSRSVTEDGEQA